MTIDMTFERREGLIREEVRNEKTIEVYLKCLERGMSEEEAMDLSGITPEVLKLIAEYT